MEIEKYLKEHIEEHINALVLLDDQISELEAKHSEHKKALRKYEIALHAFTVELEDEDPSPEVRLGDPKGLHSVGSVQEGPQTLPASTPSPKVDPPRRPSGPACTGCGSELVQGSRSLNNGRVVNLWMCTDSGCNNEVLA